MNANDERRLTFGRLSDAIVLAIWVLLALAVIVDSQSLKEPAGRFPTLSAITIALIAATRLALLARGARFESDSYSLSDARRTLLFFVGLAVLWILVFFAGLLLGGGVWAVAALVTIYRWPLLRSAIYTVAFVAAMAVIFPALGLQLPAGILTPR